MQIGNCVPAYRHHFCCCIELHCARAKWDHCTVKRQILIGQTTQKAHHLGFGTVRMEHILGQEAFATSLGWHEKIVIADWLCTKQNSECCKIVFVRGFIKGHTNRIRIDDAEQTATLVGFVCNACGFARKLNRDRIEQAVACDFDASSLEARCKARRKTGNTRCNGLKACRAMPDGEGCSHIGEQRLCGADV